MSRKVQADRSDWHQASLFAFSGGYGPFKESHKNPIENVLVLFVHCHGTSSSRHPMHPLAGQIQELLLNHPQCLQGVSPNILVVDLSTMGEDVPTALLKEATERELTKGFGRTLLRLLERLRLHQVTAIAYTESAPLLVKLVRAMHPEACKALWLIHPTLSPKFVNLHLVNQPKQIQQLHLVFETELARDKRLQILRHIYPNGTLQILQKSVQPLLLLSFLNNDPATATMSYSLPSYDPDYCNPIGHSLFLSTITVEMSKYTKQYERYFIDITSHLLHAEEAHVKVDPSIVDWSKAERQIGALVLRGNRCVLVRSLNGVWNGMKIPSLVAADQEPPHDTAVRAVVHYTQVVATEVMPLPDVPPVEVFTLADAKPIRIHLYALYATEPPPDGPLEDADMEDDETPYDWYTFPNAIQKLDPRAIAALQTMALILIERANLGLIPCKWGGVFGQELQMVLAGKDDQSTPSTHPNQPKLTTLTAPKEEWLPSRAADVLQDVRKANEALMQKIRKDGSQQAIKKLPVTLLSGFLGSGKTTLLTHILTNYSGLKVAILVNDMGEINIDAALINNATSVRQRNEHMVQLENGCICCTLREDLLIEVAKIASEGSFDYLLIESTGVSEPLPVAETFTFQDSTGLTLGDIAAIDTLVTVVDGSKFFHELQSLQSLRDRDWQADPEDQRTISHLLCDQVEFANVIVLNKCDLMSTHEKEKVKLLVQSMNPQAKLLESKFSKVPLEAVLGTGLFSMSEAEKHQGWLREARIGEHTPETEEYGISSFTFRALRPFVPHLLHQVLEAMLAKVSPPYNETLVLRAKGFIWFANCPQLQGEFSLAGNHYSVLPGNPWWAEIDRAEWPPDLEHNIGPLWHEPYGDRQQEIVIIGQLLDKEAVTQSLEACLVSDEEMAKGQEAWYELCNEWGDPFAEAWDAALEVAIAAQDHDLQHGHDHGHDHGHHSSLLG